MRFFISSTRTGLEEERDSLLGLIKALGHEPVVFEQFTAQPTPSREACLKAVESADAYLLLLGPKYGWEWPETGLSATHEEYRAARARGIPRVAFRKLDVDLEAKQQAFADEVEAYATGLFRASFRTIADLMIEVTKAVRELEQGPKPLLWRRLSAPVDIAWRREQRGNRSTGLGTVLEIYVKPTPIEPRTATQLRQDAQTAASTLRSLHIVDQSRSLRTDFTATHATVEVDAASRSRRGWNEAADREFLGVEVDSDGQVCVWQEMPHDNMGTLLNEALVAVAVEEALRLAGQLVMGDKPEVVLAASLRPLQSVNLGNPSELGRRSQASIPSYRVDELRVPVSNAVTAAALSNGAPEAAGELTLRILDALRQARR